MWLTETCAVYVSLCVLEEEKGWKSRKVGKLGVSGQIWFRSRSGPYTSHPPPYVAFTTAHAHLHSAHTSLSNTYNAHKRSFIFRAMTWKVFELFAH